MKTKKLVSIFTVLLKLALFVNIIMGLAIITVAIHSTFSPTTYEKCRVSNEMISNKMWSSFYLSYSFYTHENQKNSDLKSIGNTEKEEYYFTKQNTATRFRLVFSTLIMLTLSMFVIRELLRFASNLKNPQTMFLNSSKCFGRISIYLGIFILFVLIAGIFPLELKSTFLDGGVVDATRTISKKTFSFYVDFWLIGLLVFSLLLSAVFNEAERLRLENDLTI